MKNTVKATKRKKKNIIYYQAKSKAQILVRKIQNRRQQNTILKVLKDGTMEDQMKTLNPEKTCSVFLNMRENNNSLDKGN